MIKSGVLQYILEKINYKNTYFLLDIGHLINTNLNINNEDKAIKYLYEVMGNIGKYKDYIEGIHLNLSLSGDYVKDIIKNYSYNKYEDYNSKMIKAMEHISKVDKHSPFKDNRIKEFIEYIRPKFLVYELSFKNKEELIKNVKIQNYFLK